MNSDLMRNQRRGDGSETTDYYERCVVKESQAIVNTNWAVEILSNYANSVQCERNGFNEYYIRGFCV